MLEKKKKKACAIIACVFAVLALGRMTVGDSMQGENIAIDIPDLVDINLNAAKQRNFDRRRGRSQAAFVELEAEVQRILGKSGEAWDGLWDGDIVLADVEQLHEIMGNGRKKRQMTATDSRLWPNPLNIPYFIAGTFSAAELQAIQDGINAIEAVTCFHFREQATSPATGNYINVIRGTGCSSFVGNVLPSGQDLSLGNGCFSLGIVIHEFMHAVGVYHEQSRPDRDGFVAINPACIRPGTFGNFAITNDALTNTPYDYNSIMHYGSTTFAITCCKTIDVHGTIFDFTIGNRFYISFYDTHDMNDRYFPTVCNPFSIVCQNGGYRNPRTCQTCICPDGFGSADCSTFVASTGGATCGGNAGIISLAPGDSGSIVVPVITNGQQCNYFLQGPTGMRIQYNIVSIFGVGYTCPLVGCYSWVEIKVQSSDWGLVGERYCPINNFFTGPRVSINNEMQILVWSNPTPGQIQALIDYQVVP